MNAAVLAACLLLMLGAFLGIATIEPRAVWPVLGTAALIVTAAGIVAGLLSL